MKAVILAAGRGTRLEPITRDLPKCMVPVGGVPLIDRMIARIGEAGIDDVVVISGHCHEALAGHLAASTDRRARAAQVVFNRRFAEWGNFYSLLVAEPALAGDGFLKLDGDVLLGPAVLPALLAAPGPAVLAVDRKVKLGAEEMKVRVRCGRVVEINKTMDPELADGENLGIAKFGPEGARVLIEEMDALVAAGEHKAWVPRAFQAFALRRPLYAVGTRGYPWTEIDFPEDYRRACEEVLPAIEALPMASHPFVRPAPQPVRTEIIARGA